MQLLTYTNLAGESIHFGGSPPFVLDHIEGTEGTDISRKTFKGANQDGEQTESAIRTDRKIDVTFNLMTYGRSDMYRTRADLLCSVAGAEKAFDRNTGEKARLTYQNDFGTWWTWAVPKGAPKFSKRIQSIHPKLKMSFDCDSPYWFAMEEEKGGFDVAATSFHFPMRFPIRFGARETRATLINSGHARAPVRIVIRGEGEKPSVINRTTGRAITLTSPLGTGAILRINTDPTDLYVRMEADGVTVNAYGLLDATTPLSDFYLAPGPNVIEYQAGGAAAKTAISLYWRNRYEGV